MWPGACFRFSARYREYKYFIVQRPREEPLGAGPGAVPGVSASAAVGDARVDGPPAAPADAPATQAQQQVPMLLDIGAMREAAQHLVGDHDYRNFCKPDVASVGGWVGGVGGALGWAGAEGHQLPLAVGAVSWAGKCHFCVK